MLRRGAQRLQSTLLQQQPGGAGGAGAAADDVLAQRLLSSLLAGPSSHGRVLVLRAAHKQAASLLAAGGPRGSLLSAGKRQVCWLCAACYHTVGASRIWSRLLRLLGPPSLWTGTLVGGPRRCKEAHCLMAEGGLACSTSVGTRVLRLAAGVGGR